MLCRSNPHLRSQIGLRERCRSSSHPGPEYISMVHVAGDKQATYRRHVPVDNKDAAITLRCQLLGSGQAEETCANDYDSAVLVHADATRMRVKEEIAAGGDTEGMATLAAGNLAVDVRGPSWARTRRRRWFGVVAPPGGGGGER